MRTGTGSGRARPGLAAALLAAAAVLGTAATGHAQAPGDDVAPRSVTRARSRTLFQREAAETQLGFPQLLDRHVRYKAGGLARLPAAPTTTAPRPGVYVTVTPGEVMVYDRVVARLAGGAFAPAAVAGCVDAGRPGAVARPVRCVPTLRAVATRALAEEAARLRSRDVTDAPTALLVADQTLPFLTFLQAAYSVALGTVGAPPNLQLLVRSGSRAGAVPFFLLPPRVIRMDRGLTPLILVVRLNGGRISLETTSHYGSGRRALVGNLAALERAVGELRARDPDRSVAFVTADRHATMHDVVAVMAALRGHYPNLVLGETGPVYTQAARHRGRRRE